MLSQHSPFQVLKSILVREGTLSEIEVLARNIMRPQAFVGDEPDYKSLSSKVLELLSKVLRLSHTRTLSILYIPPLKADKITVNCHFKIRNQNLEIVEAIERWRAGGQSTAGLSFCWQNTNYLLKMCHDLDYLCEVGPVIQLLGCDSASVIHNPLMLENTLDQPRRTDTDASGMKARLRQAELVLIAEEGKIQNPVPRLFSERRNPALTTMSMRQPSVAVDSLLSWYEQAQAQLVKLKEPLSKKDAKSTGRLHVSAFNFLLLLSLDK